MIATKQRATAEPTTAALQPIDRTELETVEGGLASELLTIAYYLYRYGFVPPLV
jgi:hypothetical protein